MNCPPPWTSAAISGLFLVVKLGGSLMLTNAQVMNSRLICAIGDWLVIAVCPRLDRTARS